MRKWLVWRPSYGESRDDARALFAPDPSGAAERFAEKSDQDSAEYSIVSGNPVEVFVCADVGGSDEFRYIVTGEAVPCYTARLVVAERAADK